MARIDDRRCYQGCGEKHTHEESYDRLIVRKLVGTSFERLK